MSTMELIYLIGMLAAFTTFGAVLFVVSIWVALEGPKSEAASAVKRSTTPARRPDFLGHALSGTGRVGAV